MKKCVETQIEIEAAAEKIWRILEKTEEYGDWNPFIRSVSGPFKNGLAITVVINPPGNKTLKFRPTLLKTEFPEIRWLGKLLFTGLFDGEHYFRLEEISPTCTRFIHGESFSGILVGPMAHLLKQTHVGFQLMNEALKRRAEQ